MHDDRVDDTVDVVHGHQQLSLFNAHYYRRCFLPIHVYDAATCRPVAMVLRLGKTPTGEEIRGYLRRLVRRIRARWPTTRILIRGDGHYGRAHVMARCENNGVDYPFGQPGNKVLQRLVDESADDIRTAARSSGSRCCAAMPKPLQGEILEDETSRLRSHRGNHDGLDIRFVVTNLDKGSAEHIYDVIYCARGRAET